MITYSGQKTSYSITRKEEQENLTSEVTVYKLDNGILKMFFVNGEGRIRAIFDCQDKDLNNTVDLLVLVSDDQS